MTKKAPKFKVGDQVVGNKKANCYRITKQGWIGKVTNTNNEYIRVTGTGTQGEWVDVDMFDLYKAPAKKAVVEKKPEVIKINDGDYFIATKKGVRGNAAKCCGVVIDAWSNGEGAILAGTNLAEENNDYDQYYGFPTFDEQEWDKTKETIKDAFRFSTFEIVKDKRQIAIINAHKIAQVAGHKFTIKGDIVSFGCGNVQMKKKQAIFFADLAKTVDAEKLDSIGQIVDEFGFGFIKMLQKASDSGLFKDLSEFTDICYNVQQEGVEFMDMNSNDLMVLKGLLTKK